MSDTDLVWMRRALRLAAKGGGGTSPNPMVGALLVKNDKVVSKGYHRKAGEPHAEQLAVKRAGKKARGATVYTNLEPCCHHGRTPPCADILIEAGIKRAVVGMQDPNVQVCGGGIARLRKAGIDVRVGVAEKECMELNEAFAKHITTGKPFGVLKAACSLDGKIATRTGESQWISNEKARRFAHGLRSRYSAILVGIGTVLADDPLLTCRIRGGHSPIRVVVDSGLRMPENARMLDPDLPARTIIACLDGIKPRKEEKLNKKGVQFLRFSEDGSGRVSMARLFDKLGAMGINSVLIEGGAAIHYSCLESGIVDRAHLFIAPILIGGNKAPSIVGGLGVETLAEAFKLSDIKVRRLGDNIHLSGRI